MIIIMESTLASVDTTSTEHLLALRLRFIIPQGIDMAEISGIGNKGK